VRISVELVPRSLEALERELAAVKCHLPGVDTVNIPDLLRFETRSWQACACAKTHFVHAIPHLRAIDINLKKPLPIARFLEQHDLNEVLVISGDPPADMAHPTYATSSLQAIKKLRAELPGVKVYAALDPYRQSFTRERDFALEKLEAGASGLFTQPFFDVRLMEVYAELLPEVEIFWGVTSITRERSLAYWQNRNRAIFPADFEASMAWSQKLAKRALEFVKQRGGHIYFMPIRASAVNYLRGVLEPGDVAP
jgi:methylenetetrahydrofolate reductase (NADPH)